MAINILLLGTPGWIAKHRYPGLTYDTFVEHGMDELRERLDRFRGHTNPDVSVVIPAWNEENNLFRTLSSLASSTTKLRVEIIVVNNNSSDRTQGLLDDLGVKSHFQPIQGISHARQLGLEKARGKYHLCADSDTLYPPQWIDLMVEPMMRDDRVVGVYGRYCFVPKPGEYRFRYRIYEMCTGLMIRLRKKEHEFMNVLGFNMGFLTGVAQATAGFEVTRARKFDNATGSDAYVDESEDGWMAIRLKENGSLQLVTAPAARVFTSSRRLDAEGGLVRSFIRRIRNAFS